MKKIIILFLVCSVSLSIFINAFSFDIDGVDSGNEWHDSTVYVLVDGESNSNINFGLVKVKLDNNNSAVYFCFKFIDPLLGPDNSYCGLKLSVNGSSYFELNPVDSPLNSKIDSYSFDGAIHIDENNGATCEVRIGFKEFLPGTISCDVQLVDSFGEPSNHYYLDLVNESFSEPTEMVIAPTADNDDPYYNSGLLTEKTTKHRTTIPKTTKNKTEKSTTKKRYTAAKSTSTTKFIISESPMIYTGRTKAPKTNPEDNTGNINYGVTVYFYEKEVIVSLVHATVLVTEKNRAYLTESSVFADETIAVELMESTIDNANIDNAKKNPAVSLSDGVKYKKASILLGAVAFVIIALCGSLYFKKK